MTPLPHTIGPEQSLASACRRMNRLGVHHLPVLDDGGLCGMVSERDILILRSHTRIDPERCSVEDAMTSKPFVVGPEMLLGAVARSMARRHVEAAVVVEENEVVGILTTMDALAVLADDIEGTPFVSPMLPSVVRERVLEEHAALRELLATVSLDARRVLDSEDASDKDLPLHARELYRTLIRHLDLEDLILAPALRNADAWGDARANALLQEHRAQREHLRTALRELDGGAVKLAHSIELLVPLILKDMAHEEQDLLTEKMLHDGIARVESGG